MKKIQKRRRYEKIFQGENHKKQKISLGLFSPIFNIFSNSKKKKQSAMEKYQKNVK